MKKMKFWGIVLPVLIGMIIVSCEKSLDDQMSQKKSGTLTVKITDAPFPADLVAEANITIDKVVAKVAKEGDMESDADSFIVVSEETASFNLLDLSNGTTAILTTAEVPVGMYNEIRLHIVDANIVLKDGETYNLKIPSGNASGLKIKINPMLEIAEGMSGEILLDFDVSRSFKEVGNDHSKNGVKFMFSPVVRCVNSTVVTSGIKGVVTTTTDNVTDSISGASIILFSGTDTITSALSSEKGYYEMLGILPATYSMQCTFAGYDTLKVENVVVERGVVLEQNLVLTPKSEEQ